MDLGCLIGAPVDNDDVHFYCMDCSVSQMVLGYVSLDGVVFLCFVLQTEPTAINPMDLNGQCITGFPMFFPCFVSCFTMFYHAFTVFYHEYNASTTGPAPGNPSA